MRDIVYYSFEYLLCAIEMLILYVFLSRLFEKRIKRGFLQIVFLISISGIIFSKSFWSENLGISIVYPFLMSLIYVQLQFELKLKMGIIYVGLYALVCWLCDLMVTGIYSLIDSQWTLHYFQRFHALRYNVAITSKLCCFLILSILVDKEIIYSKAKEPLTKGSILILSIMNSIVIVSLYGLYTIMQYSITEVNHSKVDIMVCVLSIGLFLMSVVVYWAIKLVNVSLQKEKEYELIQYKNELAIKSIEENQAVENEWHRIRHDFNNHISCIDMLLQMGNIQKARTYIQKLTKLCESQTVNIHVGNTIADAVINQKIMGAKQYNIEMEIEGEIPSQLQIEDTDLCALMSNSLDNAIEATCQIEDVTKRKIKLKIIEKSQEVCIQISNTVKEDIKGKKILITTKEDTKRHGIGMRSMTITVEKYKGRLSWECKEKIFTLSMVLPI